MKLLIKTAACCYVLTLFSVACSHILRETGCPPAQDIVPCKCNNTVLQCENIENGDDLRTVFVNSARYDYREVHIEYSSLQHLPHEMFEHTSVKELYLKNVTLVALFDSPPQSLHMLENLYIDNTRIMSSMTWALLEPLTELKLLMVHFNSIRTLDSQFSQHVTKKLQQITFHGTETRKIKPGTFAEFANLNEIAFESCKLTELSRDMFPTPFNVRVMHFNDNKITSIPRDLFTQMPNLQTLGLRNNLISLIPEAAFESNIGRIASVWFDGNPLKCDCQLQWVVRSKPSDFGGACSAPKSLYGRNLKDLAPSNFNC